VNLVVFGFMKSKPKNKDSRHKKVYHLTLVSANLSRKERSNGYKTCMLEM